MAPQAYPAPLPPPSASEAPKDKDRDRPADPNLTLVKSPIVGTFYEAASPGVAPFVRVGERVQPGKVCTVYCIVLRSCNSKL